MGFQLHNILQCNGTYCQYNEGMITKWLLVSNVYLDTTLDLSTQTGNLKMRFQSTLYISGERRCHTPVKFKYLTNQLLQEAILLCTTVMRSRCGSCSYKPSGAKDSSPITANRQHAMTMTNSTKESDAELCRVARGSTDRDNVT